MIYFKENAKQYFFHQYTTTSIQMSVRFKQKLRINISTSQMTASHVVKKIIDTESQLQAKSVILLSQLFTMIVFYVSLPRLARQMLWVSA